MIIYYADYNNIRFSGSSAEPYEFLILLEFIGVKNNNAQKIKCQ